MVEDNFTLTTFYTAWKEYQDHIKRALDAAKQPELAMKLANMPVPLSAQTVDAYMGPVLEAAKSGDFSLIKSLS